MNQAKRIGRRLDGGDDNDSLSSRSLSSTSLNSRDSLDDEIDANEAAKAEGRNAASRLSRDSIDDELTDTDNDEANDMVDENEPDTDEIV